MTRAVLTLVMLLSVAYALGLTILAVGDFNDTALTKDKNGIFSTATAAK